MPNLFRSWLRRVFAAQGGRCVSSRKRRTAKVFQPISRQIEVLETRSLLTPDVTALAPASGLVNGGASVVITGAGFSDANAVSFGILAAASYTINSDSQITAVAPPAYGNQPQTVDVTVGDPGGTSATSSADQFAYLAAPAPSVAALSPTSGPVAGGTSVTITGAGFTGATGVAFGMNAATSYTVNSDTQITAVAPAAYGNQAGAVDVTVTTGAGTSATSSADQFSYLAVPAPLVAGLSPASGPVAGGTSVTIAGAGFTGATGVAFGMNAATSYTVDSDTQITAVAPAAYESLAQTVDVVVSTPGGASATSSDDQFGYYVPAPSIASVSPNMGATSGGTSVTITGAYLAGATAVDFGVTAASSFTINADGSITAVTPAEAAGKVDVSVVTPSGSSPVVTADEFTFIVMAPIVTAISPPSGPTIGGTQVTITGSNFTGATAVNFGAIAATSFTVTSATTITAVSPGSNAGQTGAVDVTIVTPWATSPTGSADQFTYTTPAPAVDLISPATGSTAGATRVTITGTYFDSVEQVLFGTLPAATFSVNSAETQITAVSPASMGEQPGAVAVTVKTATGTSPTSSGDQFTYVSPGPVITAIAPPSGSVAGGTTVTIWGSNLAGVTSAAFGGMPASSLIVDSSTELTVVAPAISWLPATPVDITVNSPQGASATSPADQFTYIAGAPTVTAVSPGSGPSSGGTPVTIDGTGFVDVSGVDFGSQAAAGFVVVSSTEITVAAPARTDGYQGAAHVTVTTAAGTSATSASDNFTYTAPGPNVSSISPATGPASGGTTVTIGGQGFTGATQVLFGGIAATSVTVNSDSQITVVAPASTNQQTGPVDVTVTTPIGTSSTASADLFNYTAPLPTVSGLFPASGSADGGTQVTVNGTGFASVTGVSFGTIPALHWTINSPSQITVIAPASPANQAASTGPVDVAVSTVAGTSATSVADQFTYTPPVPVVNSVSPNQGATDGGTIVSILGADFLNATGVLFGSVAAASFTINSADSISAIAPASAAGATGTVDVTISSAAGTSPTSAADDFIYTSPLAQILSISPADATLDGGVAVTISGNDLSGVTAVSFGGGAATAFTVLSAHAILATAPAAAQPGIVDVQLTTAGGLSLPVIADWFQYLNPAGPLSIDDPGLQSTEEGVAVSLALSASASSGDTLAWNAAGLPAGLSLSASGTISGTVATGDAAVNGGAYTVSVTVTDQTTGAQVSATFPWNIVNTALAPSISLPPGQSTPVGQNVSLALNSTDPDGNPLVWSATGLPAGLNIAAGSGLISGAPAVGDDQAQGGVYTVDVTAADAGNSATATFSWTITTAPLPPVLANPGPQTGDEGTFAELQLIANDPQSTISSYTAAGLPAGLYLNPQTGFISGTLAVGAAATSNGTWNVTIGVTDARGDTATQTFIWSVAPAPAWLATGYDPASSPAFAAVPASLVPMVFTGLMPDPSPTPFAGFGYMPSGIWSFAAPPAGSSTQAVTTTNAPASSTVTTTDSAGDVTTVIQSGTSTDVTQLTLGSDGSRTWVEIETISGDTHTIVHDANGDGSDDDESFSETDTLTQITTPDSSGGLASISDDSSRIGMKQSIVQNWQTIAGNATVDTRSNSDSSSALDNYSSSDDFLTTLGVGGPVIADAHARTDSQTDSYRDTIVSWLTATLTDAAGNVTTTIDNSVDTLGGKDAFNSNDANNTSAAGNAAPIGQDDMTDTATGTDSYTDGDSTTTVEVQPNAFGGAVTVSDTESVSDAGNDTCDGSNTDTGIEGAGVTPAIDNTDNYALDDSGAVTDGGTDIGSITVAGLIAPGVTDNSTVSYRVSDVNSDNYGGTDAGADAVTPPASGQWHLL